MPLTKISALTSASTPLAGTEVLPIVQSGANRKVANNDLRPRQIQSNATTGVLQVAGPSAGATRVMTTPNANFTAARTDAAQSFTGDQTLGTGNLIQGTAAKGINFTANANAPGMTSELLNWYEEGTWTPVPVPTSGSITTYTSSGIYTRIGRQVTLTFTISISNAGTAVALSSITGIPFTNGGEIAPGCGREAGVTGAMWQYLIGASATSIAGRAYNNDPSIVSGYILYGSITYIV
jgi:hypothetical protein